jgi:hypothetical protein
MMLGHVVATSWRPGAAPRVTSTSPRYEGATADDPARYVTELFRAHHLELVRLAVLIVAAPVRTQFAELQASTGRLVRLLRTQTARYDEDRFTTLQDSLDVLSLGAQGRYALVQGVEFGWLDVGGPDPGQFAPLPAVPAGQYVNFAAW